MGEGKLRRVLRMGRLHFLVGGLLLYSLGATAAAASGAALGAARFLAGYGVVFFGQLSVSYSNDHFDADADRFGTPSPFSGGSGVLVESPELRPLARTVALVLIAASMAWAAAFTLAFAAGPWMLMLAAAGNALGWCYTAPPLRLAYRGLGEPAMMVTIGLLVPATGFVAVAGAAGTGFLLLVPALTAYGLLFIINVQIPDMEADRKGGKDTLVARAGRRTGFGASGAAGLVATGYLALAAALWPGGLSASLPLLAGLSVLPLAPALAGMVGRPVVREAATKVSTATVGSLFLFVGLADGLLLMNSLW